MAHAHADAALKPVLDYLSRAVGGGDGGDDSGPNVAVPKTEAGAAFAAMKRKLQGSVAKKSGQRPAAGQDGEKGGKGASKGAGKGGGQGGGNGGPVRRRTFCSYMYGYVGIP